MTFIKIGFIDIGIGDILDVLFVAFVLYQTYRLLKGTIAFNIFIGLAMIYWSSLLVQALEMRVLAKIMGQFLGAGFVLLVIVFQPEIRRFLFYMGKGSGIGNRDFFWQKLLRRPTEQGHIEQIANEIAKALRNMAETKTGALLVLADPGEKAVFINTGVRINGEVSGKLLESIFDKGSPLHDGAVVIAENKIVAAGCVLPVSENPELPKRVGMRHRAAVGISEQINADVLIVSEQMGKISHARKGQLTVNVASSDLYQILVNALKRI